MKIDGAERRIIELTANGRTVRTIDQRELPWRLEWVEIDSATRAAQAIREMWVRGAPLIGATAAYGLALGLLSDASDESLARHHAMLLATRPTAVNLRWALDRVRSAVAGCSGVERIAAAYRAAAAICDEDVAANLAIGRHGLALLETLARREARLNILTHCNAGALATVDHGTALSPIYAAQKAGLDVHVWVDETRPRNQGALLTAFELAQAGIAHTVIADNAGGLLMQRGAVDLCIVGADRVTRNGDVCNKVGTYLKALAARDNALPFYVAVPSTTFDPRLESGGDVPIEERSADEVTTMRGMTAAGRLESVTITDSPAANPAFDITPARLVSGYVTERGIVTDISGWDFGT